ncbi:hypothetical protein OS493_040570, partial [Desmophyllum pertusum]
MLKLYVATVVRHITENMPPDSPTVDGESGQTASSVQFLLFLITGNGLKSPRFLKTPELMRREDVTKSLDRGLRKHNSCEELRYETTGTWGFGTSSPSANIPRADVEPIIRPDLLPSMMVNPSKLE